MSIPAAAISNLPEDDDPPGDSTFVREVFPAELDEIAKRRECAYGSPSQEIAAVLAPPKSTDAPAVGRKWYRFNIQAFFKKTPPIERTIPPSTKYGLVGLALSGGGIRSATFNLGVLQSLAEHGILKQVDYLSTVSGGGYIGSCLSSILTSPDVGTDPDNFPFAHKKKEEEPRTMKHLRSYGNYLVGSGGITDIVRIPTLLLRGIFLNLLGLLPYILAAVILTGYLHGLQMGELYQHWRPKGQVAQKSASKINPKSEMRLPVLVRNTRKAELSLARHSATQTPRTQPTTPPPPTWLSFYKVTPYFIIGLVILSLVHPLLILLRHVFTKLWGGEFGRTIILTAIALLAVFYKSVRPAVVAWRDAAWQGPRSPDPYLVALTLLFMFIFFYFLLRRFSTRVDALSTRIGNLSLWQLRDYYERALAGFALLTMAIILWESLPVATVGYALLWDYTKLLGQDSATWGLVLTTLLPFVFSGQASKLSSKLGSFTLYALGLLGPFILILIYFRLSTWLVLGHPPHLVNNFTPNFSYQSPMLLLSVVALWIVTNHALDMNFTSMHRFYRDKLSKAYLMRFHKGKIEHNDSQSLSRLGLVRDHLDSGKGVSRFFEYHERPSAAPYHLINATVNLQGSTNPHLRGRHADFLIFSKQYVGGPITGYCKTIKMEDNDRYLNLGTAMAISGAAASPNMGTTTVKPLVFILGLLNVRLGYWLPNPKYADDWSAAWKQMKPGFGSALDVAYALTQMFWNRVGPLYLVAELLGFVNENAPFVNVSDGGHIENLGAYELLRRRCKYIIICDAEQDGDMSFGGLATFVRYALVDKGIKIDIDIEKLKKDKKGLSKGHIATGTIDYGNGETGQLLYIKSSVVGDENVYIYSYRKKHRVFPHQSTSDQFFDETQFECYRSLGYHIANRSFKTMDECPPGANKVAHWIRHVETSRALDA